MWRARLLSFSLPAEEPCLSVPVCRGSLGCWFWEADASGAKKMAVISLSAGWVVQDSFANMIDEVPWWRVFAALCPLFNSFIREDFLMVPEHTDFLCLWYFWAFVSNQLPSAPGLWQLKWQLEMLFYSSWHILWRFVVCQKHTNQTMLPTSEVLIS